MRSSMSITRSSPTDVFLGKGVLKMCSKFTGVHSCQIVISIKLQSNLTKIKLRHEYSPVSFVYISRTPFPRNTFGGLLLKNLMR